MSDTPYFQYRAKTQKDEVDPPLLSGYYPDEMDASILARGSREHRTPTLRDSIPRKGRKMGISG